MSPNHWNIQDKDKDLAELLKTIQRHTKCSRNYCLRFSRKEQKYVCRFKYPIEKQEESSFTVCFLKTYKPF